MLHWSRTTSYQESPSSPSTTSESHAFRPWGRMICPRRRDGRRSPSPRFFFAGVTTAGEKRRVPARAGKRSEGRSRGRSGRVVVRLDARGTATNVPGSSVGVGATFVYIVRTRSTMYVRAPLSTCGAETNPARRTRTLGGEAPPGAIRPPCGHTIPFSAKAHIGELRAARDILEHERRSEYRVDRRAAREILAKGVKIPRVGFHGTSSSLQKERAFPSMPSSAQYRRSPPENPARF
mmetsp:Transcript_2410/g.5182  ORF Transcript_2410/g.5182 Transcript_2410/m.5182 type:complete len:236 (+) Transcript_2410:187-894(+)